MCIVDGSNVNFLAPAGRHVYSTQDTGPKSLKAPAGRHVYIMSESSGVIV